MISDVTLDVLKFLTRNDIEKCQLVNLQLYNIVRMDNCRYLTQKTEINIAIVHRKHPLIEKMVI